MLDMFQFLCLITDEDTEATISGLLHNEFQFACLGANEDNFFNIKRDNRFHYALKWISESRR